MARINQHDVDVVQRKLREFTRQLPEQEQNVLAWMLTRSQGPELSDAELEDVAGGDSITIGWSKSLEPEAPVDN